MQDDQRTIVIPNEAEVRPLSLVERIKRSAQKVTSVFSAVKDLISNPEILILGNLAPQGNNESLRRDNSRRFAIAAIGAALSTTIVACGQKNNQNTPPNASNVNGVTKLEPVTEGNKVQSDNNQQIDINTTPEIRVKEEKLSEVLDTTPLSAEELNKYFSEDGIIQSCISAAEYPPTRDIVQKFLATTRIHRHIATNLYKEEDGELMNINEQIIAFWCLLVNKPDFDIAELSDSEILQITSEVKKLVTDSKEDFTKLPQSISDTGSIDIFASMLVHPYLADKYYNPKNIVDIEKLKTIRSQFIQKTETLSGFFDLFDGYYLIKLYQDNEQTLGAFGMTEESLFQPNLYEYFDTKFNIAIRTLLGDLKGKQIEDYLSIEDVALIQTQEIINGSILNGESVLENLRKAKEKFTKVGKLRKELITKKENIWQAIHSVDPDETVDWSQVPPIMEARKKPNVQDKIKLILQNLGLETEEPVPNKYNSKKFNSCNYLANDFFRALGIKSINHRVDAKGNPADKGEFALGASGMSDWFSKHALNSEDSGKSTQELLNSQYSLPIEQRKFVRITDLNYQERMDLLKQGYAFYGTTSSHNWVVWEADVEGESLPVATQATYNFTVQYQSIFAYKLTGDSESFPAAEFYAVYVG